MICPVVYAEIENDNAQYKYERSSEHLAATLALKDERHSFISDLMANNYHTVGVNTYTLRDAIECIQDDEFWQFSPEGLCSIDELMSVDGSVESLFADGKLPQFHVLILNAVTSLADIAIGEIDS
jgi:hypothetical protein